MWLEIKIFFSIIATIFIAIVLSQILFLNGFLAFILIMAIGMIIFGDVIIGHRLKSTRANFWYERPPPGKELIVIKTVTGLLDLVWANKKPEGKREFVYNGQEAAVIDKGDDPIHTLAGARGCLAHETIDENINTFEAEAVNRWTEEYKTNDLKELYYAAKNQERGL